MVFKNVYSSKVKAIKKPKPVAKTAEDKKQDKQINKLMKIVGSPEIKYFDLQSTTYQNVTDVASLYSLSILAQGNDITNRIADKIKPRYLMLRYILDIINIPTTTNNKVRIAIVQDRFQSGVVPTFSGVSNSLFEIPTATLTEILVPKLKTNMKQFKVLYDEVHQFGEINNTATQAYALGVNGIIRKKYFKLNGTINYSSTAGANASNKENNIYMFVVSNNASVEIKFAFYSRLAYTDA